MADTEPEFDGLPWRVGRKVGRTIYDRDDQLIGIMDTPQLASFVVSAANLTPLGQQAVRARLVTPSRTDRQPPASSSETKGGLDAVTPETTNHPDLVTHHEET